MRHGSPNWFVRKGKIFQTTGTPNLRQAGLVRDKILHLGKQKKLASRKFISEVKDEFFAIKGNLLHSDSFQNHYVYPWKTLEPDFGDIFIDELTISDWKSFVSKMRRKDPELLMFSYHTCLNGIVRYALESNYINEDPKIKLDRSREKEPEVNPWTDNEVEMILKNSEGQLHLILKLMAYRGLRPKEARNLKWSFLDEKEKGFDLPAYEKLGDKKIRYTKTAQARFIPLGSLYDSIRSRFIDKSSSAFVFHTFGNESFTKDGLEKQWEVLRDSLKLSGGLYRFRHYSIIRMLKHNINPIAVAKIHGHDIKTLYKKYSRFLKEDLTTQLGEL